MGLNHKGAFSLKNISVFVTAFVLFGCAAMQKPQGGPKDRTPPKLLKATPENMTRNFSAKQIRLDFDEYFDLKNPFQEITVSPAQEKAPTFKKSGKSIIVDFKDTLQKNTTYVINFGKAIADVNEGNILTNFTYVFSTGPHIDSLSVSGDVTNTLTGEHEKDVTVMLLTPKQDTLWGKKKPTIFATTDSAGNFSLNNLHVGEYHIYALKETNPNRIYDNENELVGFLKQPIHLTKDTANIHLKLFKQEPEKIRLTEKRFDIDGKLYFTFNKPLENASVRILAPADLDNQKIVDFNKTNDTVGIFMRSMDFDSVKVEFRQNNKPIDTTVLRKGRKETYTRNFALTYNVTGDNKLKPATDLKITSNLPIETIDQSLITFNEDSTYVSNFKLTKDTATLKKLTLKYPFKPDARYQIIFNEDALTDIYGDKNNKKLVKVFNGDRPDNYGMLTLKVKVPDTSKGYVIEMLNSQKKVVRTNAFTNNTTITYKNYPVGKYNLRVVYDDNKNGKWDSGNVKRREYPENTWLYTKEITIRSNWDAEENIDIPKEPTTP
jgi:uncharacterized protein (DUF2141 family)